MDSGLEGSSEVMAAHELENSWCILNHDEGLNELCEEIDPKKRAADDDEIRSISSTSSDIEVIAEVSSESESLTQSFSALDSLLSSSPSYATFETSELLLNPEEEIDLNPGIKVYRKPYTPNTKVNCLLNISLLVALAAVTGLGIGNYMTNRGLTTREKEQMLKLQSETCIPLNRTKRLNSRATSRSLSIATSNAITTISTSNALSMSHQQIQVFVPIEPIKHATRYVTVDKSTDASPDITQQVDVTFCRELNKHLAIETITSFDSIDKHSRKSQKKQKSNKNIPKKLYVWLLLTDKGTSRPVFFYDNPRKDELAIISKLFMLAHFGKERSVLWLSGCPQCLSLSPKLSSNQIDIVNSSDNYWFNRQEKLMKHFWSKVKYSLYSSAKVDSGKDLKDKIYDAILSLTESDYIQMFAKLRSKVKKAQAKDSLCGESV